METKKDYSSWILKNPNDHGIELIFDESELSIQRDLKNYWSNILFALLCSFSSLGYFLIYYGKNGNAIYVFSIVILILLLFITFEFSKIWKARKMNERVYMLSEIKLVRTETRKNKVKISIEFRDGIRDEISIIKNRYYELFIDTLKKNSIKVI